MEIDGINYKLQEDGTAIVVAAENKCGYSGHVSIPESVTFKGKEYPIVRLDAYCFCESDVEFCTIPNGKYKIEIWDCVFLRCPKLKEIVIPDSVTVIGEAAFCDCTALDSVKIGKSVAEIGDNAFRNCTSLTSIVVDAENPTYDSRNNCNAIIETKSKTLICGKDTTIIPEGIVRIGYAAFDGCNFTSITIPNSVRKIEEIAFNNCTKLASVVIPQGVTSIGAAAFGNCESLTSVNIPDTLTYIAERAFKNCKSLTSITLPNSVITIGKEAFNGCSGLTSISIPDSVTKIEERAFAGCQSLTTVKIGNVPTISGDVFNDCPNIDIALISVWIGGFTPIIIERYNLEDDIRTLTPYKICRYVRENWDKVDSEIVDSYVDGHYFLPSDLEVYINDEECKDYPWNNIGKDYVFDKEQVYGIMSSDYTTYAAALILPLDTKFEPRRLYIDSIYYVRYYTGDETYFKRHKWYKGNRKEEIVVPLKETSNPDCYPELIIVKGYAYKF